MWKLIKTPERGQWHHSGAFNVNLDQISHMVLVNNDRLLLLKNPGNNYDLWVLLKDTDSRAKLENMVLFPFLFISY